jgi:hypothetical protein
LKTYTKAEKLLCLDMAKRGLSNNEISELMEIPSRTIAGWLVKLAGTRYEMRQQAKQAEVKTVTPPPYARGYANWH